MNNVMEIVNSPIMWALASITMILIVIEAIMFYKLAFKTAAHPDVNLTQKQCKTAFKAGAIAAIGPSTGIFVVMVALIVAIGGPMAWLRISVIGGTGTELMAATVGAQAAGGDITKGLDLMQMTTAWWAMTINACGWLLFIFLFAGKMEKLRAKIGGGDTKWMEVFSSTASIGIFGAICGQYIIQSFTSQDYVTLITILVSAIAMFICLKIGDKHPKILTYSLGIAMLTALVVAAIIVPA